MNRDRSSVYKTPKTTQLYVHLNLILGMVIGKQFIKYTWLNKMEDQHKFCMYQAEICYVSRGLVSLG